MKNKFLSVARVEPGTIGSIAEHSYHYAISACGVEARAAINTAEKDIFGGKKLPSIVLKLHYFCGF